MAVERPASNRALSAVSAPQKPMMIGRSITGELNEKQPSEQELREMAVKAMETVRGRAHHAMVNSLNFAMGLAWMSFAKVAAGMTPLSDPHEADPGKLWVAAFISSILLVPLILVIAWRRAALERKADEAASRNERASALQLRVTARSLHTLSTWGFTFLVAAQLNSAASASLPRDPWTWRFLYICLLFLAVSLVSAVVTLLGPKDCNDSGAAGSEKSGGAGGGGCCGCGDSRLHAAMSDSIISGSGYVVTLAFLELISAAFELQNISSSEDLGYLTLFTALILAVTSAAVVVLLYADNIVSNKACALHRIAMTPLADATDGKEIAYPMTATVTANLRKLVAKVVSLSGVVALYALMYVCLMSVDAFRPDGSPTSLYAPLRPWGATIFLAVTVVVAALGGGLLELALGGLARRVALADKNYIPGPIDDVTLDFLQALSTTTLSTLVEALAWLVGCAAHALAGSLWGELLRSPREGWDFGDAAQLGAALAYCLLISCLAVTVTLFCAPPPLHGI